MRIKLTKQAYFAFICELKPEKSGTSDELLDFSRYY